MVLQHLRYSPVNWLVVPWAFRGTSFSDCGLPKQQCCVEPEPEEAQCCAFLPITEAIDTYGWARWLPEIIVGIDDPDEEIAASYARESAIEFCRDARVLQREVVIELQKEVNTYPVFPYEGEQIVGVLGAQRSDDNSRCCVSCGQFTGSVFRLDFQFDAARNEITVQGCWRNGALLRLLVWSAPTEDACAHDVFLYDAFRSAIARRARFRYAQAVHFRDPALMRSLQPEAEWVQSILRAKRRAGSIPSARHERTGSMWR